MNTGYSCCPRILMHRTPQRHPCKLNVIPAVAHGVKNRRKVTNRAQRTGEDEDSHSSSPRAVRSRSGRPLPEGVEYKPGSSIASRQAVIQDSSHRCQLHLVSP